MGTSNLILLDDGRVDTVNNHDEREPGLRLLKSSLVVPIKISNFSSQNNSCVDGFQNSSFPNSAGNRSFAVTSNEKESEESQAEIDMQDFSPVMSDFVIAIFFIAFGIIASFA